MNIFGNLWGGKACPCSWLICIGIKGILMGSGRNSLGIIGNLLGIIGNLLEELCEILWKYESIKCSIIVPLFITILTPRYSEIQDLTISSSAAHKLKPSLSICVTSRIPNLPSLELVHYSYNIEGTSLKLISPFSSLMSDT